MIGVTTLAQAYFVCYCLLFVYSATINNLPPFFCFFHINIYLKKQANRPRFVPQTAVFRAYTAFFEPFVFLQLKFTPPPLALSSKNAKFFIIPHIFLPLCGYWDNYAHKPSHFDN